MTTPILRSRWSAARAGTDARDSRFDGLHAEAKAAVGYSANTLRSVRERYREAYSDSRGRWQALRDELDPDRPRPLDGARPRPARPGPIARRTPRRPAPTTPAARTLRGDVETLGRRPGRPPGRARQARARRAHARADVALPRARRRHAADQHVGGRRPRATSRCGSSRPRRPSGRGWPRRSTTARPRRSATRSSRSSTSSGSSTRTRRSPRTELRFLRELLRRELGDVRDVHQPAPAAAPRPARASTAPSPSRSSTPGPLHRARRSRPT